MSALHIVSIRIIQDCIYMAKALEACVGHNSFSAPELCWAVIAMQTLTDDLHIGNK